MDPVSVLASCYAIAKRIYAQQQTAEANKEQSAILAGRINTVLNQVVARSLVVER